MSPEKAIRELKGRELGGCFLEPAGIRRGRTVKEAYFSIFLSCPVGDSAEPVVQGLYRRDVEKAFISWVEFRYRPSVRLPGRGTFDLVEAGLTEALFLHLRGLIGPGGAFHVIYGAEPHPFFRETETGLRRGFPPPLTPLGAALWRCGFRWFKDWYFPEGWLEGSMKLQATLPLDAGSAEERKKEMEQEVERFVRRVQEGKVERGELLERALLRARELALHPSEGKSRV